MTQHFLRIASLASLLGLGASVSGQAQTTTEDKIAVYEKQIQALQNQIDQLKKDVAELRTSSQKPTPPPRAQVFGFLQSQFESTSPQETHRFLMRRVRLGVRGQLEKDIVYELQADLASSSNILRNVWIDYTGLRGGAGTPFFRFGQFKLPYSAEAIDSGAVTPFVERAIVVDQLAFNHDRDTGIGLFSKPDAERPYGYALALVNGNGRNQFVASPNKLVVARLQLNTPKSHPVLGGTVAVGFATRQGHVANFTLPIDQQIEDERYEVDFDYQSKLWRLRGEYLWGRNQALKPSGYYSFLSYRPGAAWEALFRYEEYTSGSQGPSVHRTTLGVSYLFSKNTKGMLNYEFVDGNAPNNQGSGLRLRLQTLFP